MTDPGEVSGKDTFARVIAIVGMILSIVNSAATYIRAQTEDKREAESLLNQARVDLSGAAGGIYVLSEAPRNVAERAKLEAAREKIEKALTFDDSDPLAATLMGIYYAKLQNSTEARKWLARADGYARAHTVLAMLARDEGDWKMAEREYGRARELEKGLPAANLGMAACLVHAGKHKDAVPYLERCIDSEPTYAPCYIELGNVYIQLKQGASALSCYERCLQIDDTLQPCYHNAITVALHIQDRAKAEELHAKAASRGIAFPPLPPPAN